MGKSEYGRGYAEGQKDGREGQSLYDIAYDAVVPGTLPQEKGGDYKSGYDDGKADSRRK